MQPVEKAVHAERIRLRADSPQDGATPEMKLTHDALLRSELRLHGAALPLQTAREFALPGWLAAFVGGPVSVLTYDIVIPRLSCSLPRED